MEQPFSTSKVTVEYSDPHGVYKLLAPGLVPRLPLRNLHWQSHAGPLRSIDTLHVELLPTGSTDPRPVLSPDPFLGGLHRTEGQKSTAVNDGFQTQIGVAPPTDSVQGTAGHRNSIPARRHQIPGLRSTPYLKVLLVRCDDNDLYKATVRQEIRDWVKANTPPSGSKKTNAENHDAFEWLILHVVIPNTVAATQPRVTGKSESTEKVSAVSASRWRTGSSTLLEKLRSDFNNSSSSSSSRGTVDHVAQIRIGINDVPYDSLPRVVPAVPSGYKETEEDSENAWADLVSKFKSLILASFDSRVTQYEDDIKEKDAQRTLPGWNFCTFFILKEGLARGFESVGLVEDALVGYDELSVGLDMIIRDQELGGSGTAANALLAYTAELKGMAAKAQAQVHGSDGDGDEVVDMQATDLASGVSKDSFDEIPISATKKPYRELILENNVSVFDFRCYIFARQVTLLSRLGNAWSTREELLAKLKEQQESVLTGVAPRAPPRQTENEHENLAMLAEICRRTLEFIPSVSHVMRGDIQAALAEQTKSENSSTQALTDLAISEVVDNLVASFAFSIAQQILAQTSTKALPIPPSTLTPPDGHEPRSNIPEPKTMMHPARISSLGVSPGVANSGPGTAGRPPPSPNFFPGPGQPRSPEQAGAQNTAFLKAGLEELAARRAELYALSRNILEECGKKRGWSDGWDGVPVVGESSLVDMVEISLDDDALNHSPGDAEGGDTAVSKAAPKCVVSLAGIDSRLLRAALDNTDDFYRLYETMTDKALRHYTVANHTHSVQASMADLAVLKYHLGDFGAAASYFWRTTPFFGESGWSLLELSMLVMYSRCLKQLQRKDDYVKVMLKLLTKAAAAERDRLRQRMLFRLDKKQELEYPDGDVIQGVLDDILAETKSLSSPYRVPLSNFFSAVEVDEPPEYHDGRDSFSVHFKLSSLLIDEFIVENAKVRMTGQIGGAQREIWLSLPEPATIKPGKNRVMLDSNVVVPGTYEVDKIDLSASNLNLHYEVDVHPTKSSSLLKTSKVTIHHRAETLDVNLIPSNHIQLDRNNTVDVELSTGWNNISSAHVRVKAATGGLRLLTAEAKSIDSAFGFSQKPEGGLFSFGAIPSDSTAKVRFPYTMESEVPSVSLRIEVTYTTEDGTFVFSKTPSISVALALGVNVQDVFKHNALFSRFTVSTASASPLRLFKTELLGSELFDASFGVAASEPIVIFPRQPGSLLYKITRKKGVKIGARTQKTLFLKLEYSVLLDDIVYAVKQSILGALKSVGLGVFGRLVADFVVPRIQDGLDSLELERAALLGFVDTGFMLSIVSRASANVGLGKGPDGKDTASTLATFISTWQAQNPRLRLHTTQQGMPRSIHIPVDVPSMAIVHTADIQLQRQSPTEIVTTNQLLLATMHLKWTRIWDTATPLKTMADLEFSYDVAAPGEAWLVGGRRKGHFVIPAPASDNDGISSTAETEADIPLLLIPLREGSLSYPGVDIREVWTVSREGLSSSSAATPIEGRTTASADSMVDGGQGVNCETDYRNLGETVRVVADRERITLSLDASGPGGGPLVMEVGRRGVVAEGRVVA